MWYEFITFRALLVVTALTAAADKAQRRARRRKARRTEISSWLGAQVHVLARRFNTCFRRDTALNLEYDAQINALNVQGKLNR